MWRFDWHARSYLTLCGDAQRLQNIAKEAIFPLLTEATTPEQFDEALASLERMKEQLLKNKKTFHFSATAGRHYCVEECFADLVETLTTKWHLLPKLEPTPEPPAPPPKPRSLSDVIKGFAGMTDVASDATDEDKPIGEEAGDAA
jgi:hypothetical protein